MTRVGIAWRNESCPDESAKWTATSENWLRITSVSVAPSAFQSPELPLVGAPASGIDRPSLKPPTPSPWKTRSSLVVVHGTSMSR